MSSFLGIDEGRQVLEIGGTYYRPHLRGTGFNRRVKDMMLKRAFDCGIRRVEFRVDCRNARSQAAMKKLGAVREGVLRADRITWTGHVRDTVLFAILKDEWPLRPSQQLFSAKSAEASTPNRRVSIVATMTAMSLLEQAPIAAQLLASSQVDANSISRRCASDRDAAGPNGVAGARALQPSGHLRHDD